MNTALQTLFAAPFELDDVNSVSWDKHPDMVPTYQNRMMMSTLFALLVNVVGAFAFMWFLPRNAAQCKAWANKPSWHKNRAAVLNCIVFAVPFVWANYSTVSRISS